MPSNIHFADDVSLQILGDEGVMFSESRQELYIFNTPATYIWACLEEGLTIEEITNGYKEAFNVPTSETENVIRAVLGQWQGLGYIAGEGIPQGNEIDFTTAVARLLANPLLRKDFALAPNEVARKIRVIESDLECLLSLRAEDLERQAATVLVRNREGRIRQSILQRVNLETFRGTDLLIAAGERSAREKLASVRTRYYQLMNLKFALRLHSPKQEAVVLPAFAHLEIAEPEQIDLDLHLMETHTGPILFDRFVPIGSCTSLEEVVPITKAILRMLVVDRHEYFLQIHAGVVSNGQKCILLPGAPGSGKTTLTAGLAASGFIYFSDEVALIEEPEMVVRPVPLSFAVKDGSCSALSQFYPDLKDSPVHQREDSRTVRYISPPSGSMCHPPDQQQKIAWIIFPRFVVEAHTELKSIGKGEALRRLMQECVVLPELLTKHKVGSLIQWMRTVDCFELTMSSLPGAIRLIKERCFT
jgi:hypothetical protein